ncbi:MAG: winged helix-turn-helix domain-containing protein [Deinococcales bacterium]
MCHRYSLKLTSLHSLHYNDIAERIIAEGLRKSLGATPAATVNAQISASIKYDGDASPYIRVAKGIFTMRTVAVVLPPSKVTPDIFDLDESEEQYEIISSFGMFWRRESIDWNSKPKLLGMQQIGATPVDFCYQLGIYLLYDGREVIYVGRSTDRPLGKDFMNITLIECQPAGIAFGLVSFTCADSGNFGDSMLL